MASDYGPSLWWRQNGVPKGSDDHVSQDPGAIMVSMRPFSMEAAANLLAYAQTLPTKCVTKRDLRNRSYRCYTVSISTPQPAIRP